MKSLIEIETDFLSCFVFSVYMSNLYRFYCVDKRDKVSEGKYGIPGESKGPDQLPHLPDLKGN